MLLILYNGIDTDFFRDSQPKDVEMFPGMDINQNNNSVLWNAMIHPLLNMTIKGAIWYQGKFIYLVTCCYFTMPLNDVTNDGRI